MNHSDKSEKKYVETLEYQFQNITLQLNMGEDLWVRFTGTKLD